MFLNKKGMEAWILVLLLSVLVGALMLLAVFTNFGSFLEVMTGKASCQSWVDIQASRLGKPVLGIKTAATTYESPCETRVEKIKADSEDVLYRGLANKQLDCLVGYRYGKKNFYSEYAFTPGKLYCRACHEVYFDAESKQRFFDIENYQIFLNTKKPGYSSKTYAEIFTDTEKAGIEFGSEKGRVMLDAGRPFYVLFTVDTTENMWERAKLAGVVAGSFVIGRATPGVKKAIGFFIPLRLLGVKGTAVAGGLLGIAAGVTHQGFQPGVAIMTGEEVLQAGCDMNSFYMNPVVKDKSLQSKLAALRKEQEGKK